MRRNIARLRDELAIKSAAFGFVAVLERAARRNEWQKSDVGRSNAARN